MRDYKKEAEDIYQLLGDLAKAGHGSMLCHLDDRPSLAAFHIEMKTSSRLFYRVMKAMGVARQQDVSLSVAAGI